MAILRMVNYKNATLKRMHDVLEYCLNPEKADGSCDSTAISSNPYSAFYLNKRLHHKESSQRWFKVVIVSVEQSWKQSVDKQMMENLLQKLVTMFAEQGWQTAGAVHHDSQHPHFHLVIDTCNVNTGKQFSQSKRDLSELKDSVDQFLHEAGIKEVICRNILRINTDDIAYEINEEEYPTFRHTVFHDDLDDMKDLTDWGSHDVNDTTDEMIAAYTLTQNGFRPAMIYSMASNRGNDQQAQQMVQEKRVMAYNVPTKAKGRMMAACVSQEEKAKGKLMARSVFHKSK